MKKSYLIFALVPIMFLAGCTQQAIEDTTGESVVSTIPATSTAESTIPKEVTTIFSDNPETCPDKFKRRQIKEDGTVEEYCLPPEYFKLKSCSTDSDCLASAELCVNGYCLIEDEDVTS